MFHLRLLVRALLKLGGRGRVGLLIPAGSLLLHRLGLLGICGEVLVFGGRCLLPGLRLRLPLLLAGWTHVNHLHSLAHVELGLDHHGFLVVKDGRLVVTRALLAAVVRLLRLLCLFFFGVV